MNLLSIFSKYPDQEACLEHLENVRWGISPRCPHCQSEHVARKADGERAGRWNCHSCHSSFNVLSGTIMEKTQVPLQKWFLAIGLMVNAKKSISSWQLGRDLDLTHQTALFIQQRIRAGMALEQQPLLQGILEADEVYIGGKPRKANRRAHNMPHKRGRGTSKTPVIGVVERNGNVTAGVANGLSGKAILKFLKETIEPAGSLLITDGYRAYRAVRGYMPHAVIDHNILYVDGPVHTNTIESFWSLIKRAWYGTHHHYSVRNTGLFVAEACWKYNHRKNENPFGHFIRGLF